MRFHAGRVNRNELDIKRVLGGLLVQTPDLTYEDPHQAKVVTRRAPTEAELRALALGIRVCKHVKSNAIAFVKEDRTLAIGGGATSRIDPVYGGARKGRPPGYQSARVACWRRKRCSRFPTGPRWLRKPERPRSRSPAARCAMRK